MKETLKRIEDRYLENSHEYDRDVDFATHNFLSVARMSDETLDDDEIRDIQDVLAQAVEAALMSYEAYALKEQDDSQEDKESEEVNETARYEEKAKELYKYANNHDAFGDKKNARFAYAAETAIAICLMQGVVECYPKKYGSWKDICDVYVAVCKSWK